MQSRHLQKGEENDCFDAEKFPNRSHWLQGFPICSVKQYQMVHGNKLGKIINRDHVWISNIRLKLAFSVNACYFTNSWEIK